MGARVTILPSGPPHTSTRKRPVSRVANTALARPAADAVDPAVTRFLDGAWMERGLSTNTLAAYRADLMALSRWLAHAEHIDRQGDARGPARIHRMASRIRCTSALDRPPALFVPPLLPASRARGQPAGGSDRADRDAEDRTLAAEIAHRRGSRIVAECADRHRSAGQSRPHDARGAVRHGPARLRTGFPEALAAEPEPGRAARASARAIASG